MKNRPERNEPGRDEGTRPDVLSAYDLSEGLEKILGDVSISMADLEGRDSPRGSFPRRMLRKLVGHGAGPFASRVTETNFNTKRALFAMAAIIRDQQHQLDELYEELRRLEGRK